MKSDMPESDYGRILIVDDSPENIDILINALDGYKKSIAMNGEKALKIAMDGNAPDLILLDVIMPGIDGYEVCRRLKQNTKTKNIPVIFLTGQTDTESILEGFDSGAVDFVTKPFNVSELQARVNTQMALKKSQDSIARYAGDIEAKNKLITESINYASRIQKTILPTNKYLKELLGDFFIFFKPRDIVSGDFYWAKESDGNIIIIVADCTGHGVPGAFMSMSGVAFLNEIIMRENIIIPSKILDRLREMIIQSLGQNYESELKDGMDMAVISINNSQNIIQFAGAQNPIYLVRNHELIKLNYDKMPVSIHPRMDDFTNHIIDIKKNDQIYLFSDGYADQFGGPEDKKFKYKPFKQLLLKNADKSMKEQRNILEMVFNEWKGDQDQTDDVLIIGIKI
jgi:phosphoserine phosphatase RsbU/P